MLTPYSPLAEHDHAANDIALPLVRALAPHMDLHVYAPAQGNGNLDSWAQDGVTYHAGSPVRQRRLDRIGLYPYASRGSWSRKSTEEALKIARALGPDILHAEYDQAAEPLLRFGQSARTSLTLHDLPGEVAVPSRADMSFRRYWQQRLEGVKTARVSRQIVSSIDALFVRSERDRAKVAQAEGIVEIAPVGLNSPEIGWLGDRPHVVAFGGAMWRSENELTAIYLARKVMPLVRDRVPDAELRIFGARPTTAVCELGDEYGITVVGEVADYDDEFRRAGVTLAPAMVEAGLLMKAIRAMAMGCPVVLNSASASPIVGLERGVHALVGDTSDELASHVVDLMLDRPRGQQMGHSAMNLVRPHFSWQRTVEVYCDVFAQLLDDA